MAIVTTSPGDTTADYVQIHRLQAAYADAASRQAWPEVAPLFTPDAVITVDVRSAAPQVISGAEDLCGFIASAVSRFEHFQIALLNQVVELDPARGRVYTLEIRREGTDWTDAYGLYQDDYVCSGDPTRYGGWRFARRSYHSLARTGPSSAWFPFPDLVERPESGPA